MCRKTSEDAINLAKEMTRGRFNLIKEMKKLAKLDSHCLPKDMKKIYETYEPEYVINSLFETMKTSNQLLGMMNMCSEYRLRPSEGLTNSVQYWVITRHGKVIPNLTSTVGYDFAEMFAKGEVRYLVSWVRITRHTTGEVEQEMLSVHCVSDIPYAGARLRENLEYIALHGDIKQVAEALYTYREKVKNY